MIHLCDPPVFCAGCYSQNPEQAHVDFGTDFDGPVFPGKTGDPQPVDDLILCSTCLSAGARLIGMTDDAQLHAELDRLRADNDRLQRERDDADRYATRIEGAFSVRPERELKRGPGRPPKLKAAA